MRKNKQVLNNASIIKNTMKAGQKKEPVTRTIPVPPPVSTATTVETTTIPEDVKLEQSNESPNPTPSNVESRLPNITNKK